MGGQQENRAAHVARMDRICKAVEKYELELLHETSQFAVEMLHRYDNDLLRARRELRQMLTRHRDWLPEPGVETAGRLTDHMLAVTEGALSMLNGEVTR